MIIERTEHPDWLSNAYLVADREGGHAVLIDANDVVDPLLDWYLEKGEWRGRAGGYAIQGAGAALVTRIEGDYLNVVGLPVATLIDLAAR